MPITPLKLFRFVTILLTAALATMTFTHLWQLPARMEYDAGLWFTTLGLYEMLGPGGPGPAVELAAVVATTLLAAFVWARRPAFGLTAAAALLLILSFAGWWIFIQPVNVLMHSWTPGTIPADWVNYRARWEHAHAARAVLTSMALAALVWSVVAETPEGESAEEAARARWSVRATSLRATSVRATARKRATSARALR